MSNLLAIPLVEIGVETGNNEDWIDSLLFLIDPDTGEQLDLRGIDFEMEIRHKPEDHEVVLSGSTDDGRLLIGEAPQYGFLIISILLEAMRAQSPGTYFGDIRGNDGQNTRVVVTINLTIFEGITR